jgi:hypothetical protein
VQPGSLFGSCAQAASTGDGASVRMYLPLVSGVLSSSYSTSHAKAALAPASVVGAVSAHARSYIVTTQRRLSGYLAHRSLGLALTATTRCQKSFEVSKAPTPRIGDSSFTVRDMYPYSDSSPFYELGVALTLLMGFSFIALSPVRRGCDSIARQLANRLRRSGLFSSTITLSAEIRRLDLLRVIIWRDGDLALRTRGGGCARRRQFG